MTKNILITGASSGLGEEFARQYAAKGITLFLTGRQQDRLKPVADFCRTQGAEVFEKVIDVTERDNMAAWITEISASHGLDLVIANAGISGGFSGQDIQDITLDYKIFDINLLGVLNTIYPALPEMVARKSGHLVLISSLAGFVPMPSAPGYSASKAAVRFYGEALRSKLAPFNIAVTIINPGFIKSRMTAVNQFKMPFLMETHEAVTHMRAKIAKRAARVAFPWPMAIILKTFALLPSRISCAIFACLPDKNSLPKE